jgi:Ca2+-binding EF-hand superfamily protein
LIDKFLRRYRVEAKQKAQEFFSEEDGTTFDGVQRLLRTFNIFIGNEGVELALQNAGLELGDIKKSEDLLKVLAGCRVNEGFSQEEVVSAQEIFDGLEKQPREEKLIQANQLSSGLLEFEGLYCVDNLAVLMKLFPSEADDAPGVPFWEFLAWARRLRHMGRLTLYEGWIEADPEKIGFISLSSAGKMASKLGYTLLTNVINDILKESCELKGGRLDWNAAVCFVNAIYEKFGFTEAETEEMETVYNKFDYEGEGELTTLQVLDLLRYLGYKTRADQVHALIKRVDFNQNGSMDLNEFLMLMRLMRENYIQQVREAFSAAAENGQDIPLSKVVDTVLQLGEKPPGDTVSELLEGAPEKVDFERFAALADRFRECSTVEGRRRANFEDGVFRDLKKVFKGHDPGRKLLKMGELLWSLSESMVPVNTAEGRQHLFTQVEAARQAAQDAGVPDNEVGEKGETVGFYTFVHLMRRLVSDYEQKALKREHDVIKSSNLTKEEASEFRQLFSSLMDEYGDGKKCGAKPRNRSSRTIGGLLEKILSAPIVPEQALLFMLKTIGLRMSATQLVELNSKIEEYNQSGTDGWIDFVCFVQVMRWMLEVNHAGINKKIGNLVGSSAPKSE